MSQLSLDLSAELDYQLVISSRARRMSLKVEPGRGVVVTIPRRFARRNVPAFVEKNREWIESALAEVELQTPERFKQWPPRQLRLPAVGLVLEMAYRHSISEVVERQVVAARSEPACGQSDGFKEIPLLLQADPACRIAVAIELSRVLSGVARQYFPVRLAMLAEQHELSFRRVQVRGQRTLWGSCSSCGTISLNYKLLFLPLSLADYVFLHELAHTRHLDHSPAFWRQLESMQTDARVLDAQLSQSGRQVPPWLELAS